MTQMESEVSLVAGRSQREKRRSYKDLLREEEIIDAEVKKSSKKRLQETHEFFTSSEIHKKKKKHHEGHFYKDHSSGSHHKKKKRSSEGHRSLLLSPEQSASPQTAITAMGLLQAITSPTAMGSSKAFPSLSPLKEGRKEMRAAASSRKQPQVVREGLPVVGEEVELEGHYDKCHNIAADNSSLSSVDGSEGGRLTIHKPLSHSWKKKSKKSKKKKGRHREKKHSSKTEKKPAAANGSTKWGTYTTSHHRCEEEKKREDGGKRKSKDKKKKVLTAYQIFYKEYRNSILEEEPGLDFGDLSKRLADAWKQLPEGDKQVWRERSEYLQRKQIKSDSAKHVKQMQTSRQLKESSRVKGGAVVLKRQETSVAAVQNGSAPLPVNAPAFSLLREPDVEAIDTAAHLQLLGESLSLIGRRLQETEGMVTVSGSLSVLLDSVLCALGPLVCLTTQVPELNGCPQQLLSNTLDNVAYVMPGL